MTELENITLQLRRATSATAATNNVTLASGEIGFETDTGRFKIGDGSTAWNGLAYATDLSRLPDAVVADRALIDVCRPWSNGATTFAPITPGADITATLQAAYDHIAANFAGGGTIRISEPGTYLLHGAPQTGTFSGGTSNYSYAGQVLIPPLPMADTMTICLEGAVPAASGDSNTGGPNGVIIHSNATSGYLFDCHPAFTRFGDPACCWTSVTPRFSNLTFLAPDDPQCGGFNMFCTQRCQFERVYLQTPTFNGFAPSGSLAGIVLPQVNNNGDLVLASSFIRGWPTGVVLSEHLRSFNVLISGCANAFGVSGRGHLNYIDADVEECPTVFNGIAYGGINGTPNTQGETAVDGVIDFENIERGSGLDPGNGYFVLDTRDASIQGQLRVWYEGTYPLPVKGGQALDLIPLSISPSIGPLYRDGWMSTHPYDNFSRLAAIDSDGAPGQCSPSLHPWRIDTGMNSGSAFQVSADGKLSATDAPAYCFVATKSGGVSRIISVTFTLTAGGHLQIIAQSPVAADGTAINGGTTAIVVDCQDGSTPQITIDDSAVLSFDGSQLASGNSHTIDVELLYGWQAAPSVLQAQYPVMVRGYLDGTLAAQLAIPASDADLAVPVPFTYPIYEDGLALMDTASVVTLFRVRDATADPLLTQVVEATADRRAWHFEQTICTSGTFTVELPTPVKNTRNTVVNVGSGTITVAPASGTLTDLTGGTGSISLAQGDAAEIACVDSGNYQRIA